MNDTPVSQPAPECDDFYEGVRADFLRALAREDKAINLLIKHGHIAQLARWQGLRSLR